MKLDPECNLKTMSEDKKEELREMVAQRRDIKSIAVRPTNRSAARTAQMKLKSIGREVSSVSIALVETC